MIIRKAIQGDAEQIVQINLKTWRSTYSHILEASVFDQRESEIEAIIERTKTRLRVDVVTDMYVVEVDGQVVGFINFGSCRESNKRYPNASEIYAIYIDDSYQKQGIGKKLVKKAVEVLLDKNYDQLIIWALKDNPNVQFYLNLGGEPCLQKNIKIGERSYPEIGFVYDLQVLSKQLEGA